MPSIFILALSLAVVGAGISLALQQVINASLRAALGSPWWAGFASYAVGSAIMLVLALAASGCRLPVVPRLPWIAWSGGLFGAIFIGTAILSVPRLGAASVLAFTVVGQMGGALVFDQIGLLGLPQHSIGLVHAVGVVFLVLGVVLVRR